MIGVRLGPSVAMPAIRKIWKKPMLNRPVSASWPHRRRAGRTRAPFQAPSASRINPEVGMMMSRPENRSTASSDQLISGYDRPQAIHTQGRRKRVMPGVLSARIAFDPSDLAVVLADLRCLVGAAGALAVDRERQAVEGRVRAGIGLAEQAECRGLGKLQDLRHRIERPVGHA